MSRELESVRLECEYWQHVLADLLKLNDLVAKAAEPVPAIAVSLLELLIGADSSRAERIARVSEQVGEIQPPILLAQGVLRNVLELAGGRLEVLRGELELGEARGV
jgi:hypothetical protein